MEGPVSKTPPSGGVFVGMCALRQGVAVATPRWVEGVATLGAAFWPKPVIVRLSDFKSNEYSGLTGGAKYEPREENPMLGFRGASRYIAESFRQSFELECRALKLALDRDSGIIAEGFDERDPAVKHMLHLALSHFSLRLQADLLDQLSELH